MKENSKLIPLLIFALISLIYSLPILKNISYWGQMDWDQFTFWNAVPRETILKYHQFPLWNPYSNGGNVVLAHPHSSFLSPFYILVLIFGPIIGIKLEIILFLIIGLLGMFFLLKHLGLKEVSSYAGSFIFMLSSIYPLHLTEGHVEWLGMAFVPWLFLSCQKSANDRKYLYLGILFLALMLLGGGIYVSTIIILFLALYSFIRILQERRIVALKNIAIIFAGAFLLSSIKLLPMLEFLSHSPRVIESTENISPLLLSTILLGRNQGSLYAQTKWTVPDRKAFVRDSLTIDYGWHEYGAYVGIIPLFLSAVGLFFTFRKQWPLFSVGIIFLLLSLGSGSPVNLWKMVHSFPIYDSLHVPSRFTLVSVFILSIFVGLGLSKFEDSIRRVHKGRLIVIAVGFFILIDMCLVNGRILKQAFVITPTRLEENAEFSQKYNSLNLYPDISRSAMYPVFLSNSGLLDAYEVINVKKGSVLTVMDHEYKGEVYLAGGKGSARITYFSPNKIVVNVNANDSDVLVLNQNYYKGWRVNGCGKNKIRLFNGLIATQVDSTIKRVIFYYLPDSFIIGCIITGVAILAGIIFLARVKRMQ